MNILYVNTYFNGGGAEKVMRQLFYNMKSENTHTFCIVGRYQNNLPEDVKVIHKGYLGRILTLIRGKMLRNSLLSSFYARYKIVRCIKDNKIDVVHFHNIHSNYLGLNDIKVIRRYCPNIVITLHDMWVLTGGCMHAFECEKWKNEYCKNCNGNASMKKFFLAKFLVNQKKKSLTEMSIKFVVPSRWLKKCCDNSYLKNESISVINNGISIRDFMPKDKNIMKKKYRLPEDKNILLFVANGIDNPYKGFDYLIKALMLLGQKDKFVLVVIGNRDEVKLDLPFEIHMMGYVSSSEVLNEIYSAADLFILPSLADTLPFTAMEAMASGTPVVAFNVGGIPEIVSNDTGWIVEDKNEKALSNQIEEIFKVENREEYRKKQAKCHKYIEVLFDERKMLKQYFKLYESMMKK